MTLYSLKPAFQRLLSPLLPALRRRGVTPNDLTIAAIALSGLIGWLATAAPRTVAAGIAVALGLVIRMALNALDGQMARQYGMTSRIGKLLNEGGDILSDLLILLPIALTAKCGILIVLMFAVGAVGTELTGLAVQIRSGHRPYDGPMGKSDRALVMGLYAVLATYLGWVGCSVLFAAATALTAVTIVNRARAAAPAID